MRTALLAALLALPAGGAFAQSKSQSQSKPEPPRYQHRTVIDISDDDVIEGGTEFPHGEIIEVSKGSKFPSLVQRRATFLPEMIKSAEDI
jgi:hypothetical protein